VHCPETISNALSMSQTKQVYSLRLQARPTSTVPDLQLTAIRSFGLPFNGHHSRNPCNYMNHYSFTNPEGWKAELAWLVDP